MNNKFVTYNSIQSAIDDTNTHPLISPVFVTIYDGGNTYNLVSDNEDGIETYVMRSGASSTAPPALYHPFYIKGVNVQFEINSETTHPTIEYRFNNSTTWTSIGWNPPTLLSGKTTSQQISLSSTNIVYLRGNIKNYSALQTKIKGDFQKCGGLLCNIGGVSQYSQLSDYQFSNLFSNNNNLKEVKLQLTNPLAQYCYSYMFEGCTSLVTTPELPATTLAPYCYYRMFSGCTSLVTAPELPALIPNNLSYGYMFNGCSRLRFIKCNIENFESSDNCCSYWVTGVPNREPASSISNTELGNRGVFIMNKTLSGGGWKTGQSGVPHGWVTLSYK